MHDLRNADISDLLWLAQCSMVSITEQFGPIFDKLLVLLKEVIKVPKM